MVDYPRLDITPTWAKLNDSLIKLVDYVPEEKINYSPREGLWNFRGILLHIAAARDSWIGGAIQDGLDVPSVWTSVRSKTEIQEAYRRTWARVESFLSDAALLAAEYPDDGPDGPRTLTGHWIAYHLLEHDIHHRADIFHYLAMLGIETPEVGTP
jgi:uncharacterized damage-inducible protein DinB